VRGSLRVALVHYHLRTGGVTRVIRDQVDALAGIAETMVVAGEPPREPLPCPAASVPDLAYDRDRAGPVDVAAAAAGIVAAARAVWPGGASLYHFHNPTLGKNRSVPAIIGRLQAMGEAVLLQIHDFAEDGRPDLLTEDPYPRDCHYAAINRRDLAALARAGLRAEGLHYLPNAVRPLRPPAARAAPGDASLFLYPVRAIRRKNVGEAVLLSLFVPDGCEIGVTLEPTGALDRRSYEAWKAFARERSLPIRFGIGVGRTLDSLLAGCRGVITTSVKEGFGFAYLEPWTAGLPLYGRYLPEVCPDFREAGLALDHLYRDVRVTLSPAEAEVLARKRRLCAPGGPPPAAEADFGCLSEDLQRRTLARVIESAAARARLVESNPALAAALRSGLAAEVVEANRQVVLSRFSLASAGAALAEAYRGVLGRPVRHSIEKAALLRELAGSSRSLLLCPASWE
jgi:hypothetical protein